MSEMTRERGSESLLIPSSYPKSEPTYKREKKNVPG